MTNTTLASKSLESRLRRTTPPDADRLARLRDALALRADAEGLVDVAFERHASPLGTLLLGATPHGLVRIGLPNDELAERISARVLHVAREPLARARRQLDDYFAGRRRAFELALDWQLTRGFRRDVLRATAQIPYGSTASYREIARRAGSPSAFRATGSALAANPLPIVVPCHRVLPASGELGSYRGGAAAKAQLLALEGAR